MYKTVNPHITGTPEERGITAWQTVDEEAVSSGNYQEGFEVYQPWLPARVTNASFMTYIPFMPNPKKPRPGAPSVGGPRKEKKFSTHNSHWALIKISFIELLQLFRTLL